MKIGLTLSGGGFRATVFHLGVLARLAEENLLEQVAVLSTVSGGSICGALVYAGKRFTWPTSSQFIEQVMPHARHLLTTQNLQLGLLMRAIRAPLTIFDPKANTLSDLLQERWGITARLNSIPKSPRWLINATCYESGKNWRFESFRMGDYSFGYTNDTNIPLSHAVAASSGFPVLIGPLVLDTRRHKWFKYRSTLTPMNSETLSAANGETEEITAQGKTEQITPPFPSVHLWDGGVYDNFGLEGVFDFDTGWRHDLDFLIVSDAAGRPMPQVYRPRARSVLRLVNLMGDQVRSLRTRAILERMRDPQFPGAFLQIGNTCRVVLRNSKHKDEIAKLSMLCLGDAEADLAANTPTMIKPMSEADFNRLFRHGFEVADYTLYAFSPQATRFFGFIQSRWMQAGSPAPAAAVNPAL
ncbi:MAG: patatin-like phospholipase family protein [Chloroflexi bacterium]|nr:patatin-like phospholipase family protein [Chloroflexota bacterium]